MSEALRTKTTSITTGESVRTTRDRYRLKSSGGAASLRFLASAAADGVGHPEEQETQRISAAFDALEQRLNLRRSACSRISSEG